MADRFLLKFHAEELALDSTEENLRYLRRSSVPQLRTAQEWEETQVRQEGKESTSSIRSVATWKMWGAPGSRGLVFCTTLILNTWYYRPYLVLIPYVFVFLSCKSLDCTLQVLIL